MTTKEKRRHHFGTDGVCNDCSADAGSGFAEYNECPGQMVDGKRLRDVLTDRVVVPNTPRVAR